MAVQSLALLILLLLSRHRIRIRLRLEAFDRFSSAVKEIVEMPDREVERLRGFLAQGHGHLPGRAREQEFRALTDEEATRVEALYNELLGDIGPAAV